MPRVARPARDVVIRVPKLLPYSKPSAKDGPGAEADTAGAASSASSSQNTAAAAVASHSNGALGPATDAASAAAAAAAATTAAPLSAPATGADGLAAEVGADGSAADAQDASSAAGALPQTQHSILKGETSAAEWNSLLIWARRQRGPQWDTGTAVWQVDRHSQEFYSFCADPTQSVLAELDPSAPAEQRTGAASPVHGGHHVTFPPDVNAPASSLPSGRGGLLEAHDISGAGAGNGAGALGGVGMDAGAGTGSGQGAGGMLAAGGGTPMMGMIGGGRGEREESPPIVGPGRSARLRAGRA
ncbi:hypothetical protein OC835_000490 [Tilletia horrida]|nr:hypothetical protein OC835_000490 [Tilletia horrida]